MSLATPSSRKEGSRIGTDDAESEGDHAVSTGAVACEVAPDIEARPKLAKVHREPAHLAGQGHAGFRRPRVERPPLERSASPKSSAKQSDDGGDEQEDRVHCCLLNESTSLLLIVERAWFKSTNPTSRELSLNLSELRSSTAKTALRTGLVNSVVKISM